MRRGRTGFSLIELLVVIAIVVVLGAMLVPTVTMVRDAARTADCLGRMRQLGIATGVYVAENEGLLYQAQVYYAPTADSNVNPIWGMWPGRLMPYLVANFQGSTLDGNDQAWNRYANCPAGNWTVAEIRRIYQSGLSHGTSCAWCSSYGYNGRLAVGTAATSYSANGQTYQNIRVGNAKNSSGTILLGEKWGVADTAAAPDDRAGVNTPDLTPPVPRDWPRQSPAPIPANSASIRVSHRGRMNLLFLDLHVGTHAVAETWNGVTWNAPGSWWAGLP